MNVRPVPEDPAPYVLAIESAEAVHMHAYRRLTDEDVAKIRELLAEPAASLRAISNSFGVSHVAIWKLKEGLTYKETQA